MKYCGSYVFALNAIHLCPNMPLSSVSQTTVLLGHSFTEVQVGKCFSHKSKAFSGDVLVNILLHTEGSCRQGRKGSSAHL